MPPILLLALAAVGLVLASKKSTTATADTGSTTGGGGGGGSGTNSTDLASKGGRVPTKKGVTVTTSGGFCLRCPFKHWEGPPLPLEPGGHAPFRIRPGDDPVKLHEYYGAPNELFEQFAIINRLNPNTAGLRQMFAEQPGRVVLIPGSWNPYNKPIPNPGSIKTAAVPTEWPAYPPIGPIVGVEV